MRTAYGSSIKDVSNEEGGKGSKISQVCLRIGVKNCRHGGEGVKNKKNLPTSFNDGS